MKNNSGRSMIEIIGVLAIIGLLSVGGLTGYSLVMRQKNVDNVVDTLSRTMVEIDLAKPKRRITDPDKLNAFLKRFETTVGPYKISFHASQDENGQFLRDGSFVSDITYKNGDRIKGSVCRKLITKMAEQKFASDVSFTLEDEGVTVELNGKVVNLDDLCGG